jgi:hypothetical protein
MDILEASTEKESDIKKAARIDETRREPRRTLSMVEDTIGSQSFRRQKFTAVLQSVWHGASLIENHHTFRGQ